MEWSVRLRTLSNHQLSFYVSILGLMEWSVRQIFHSNHLLSDPVSILGLMEWSVRLFDEDGKLHHRSFNPWFNGMVC